MNIKIIFLITINISCLCFSQNLVQNPSFENYGGLGCNYTQHYSAFDSLVNSWTIPTMATSDIHSTLTNRNCITNAFSTSVNAAGEQQPRTGTQMAGIMMYSNFTKAKIPGGYREYLQVQLSSPLVVNQNYYVEYWVSLAENYLHMSNNFGAYFSDTIINQYQANGQPFQSVLNLTPQINYKTIVTDSINWVKISGCFKANSASKYLIIGNFFSNYNTVNANIKSYDTTGTKLIGKRYSYYYVDDVLVEPRNLTGLTTSKDTTICEGDSILIHATNGIDYTWSNGMFGNSIRVNPDSTTNYYVFNGDSNCESDSITVFVTKHTGLKAYSDTSICLGDSVKLYAENGTNYLWNNLFSRDSLLVSPYSTSTYTVKNGESECEIDSVLVIVYNLPKPTLHLSNTHLSTAIFNSYQWILDGTIIQNETSQHLNLNIDGIYSVKVSDTNNCYNISPPFIIDFMMLDDIELKNTPVIVPNPAYNNIKILNTNYPIYYTIIDHLGRIIEHQTYYKDDRINISHLSNGIYHIEIRSTNGIKSLNFIKE